MKKTIILALYACLTSLFGSPVVFYKTYKDYVAKKGEVKGEFKSLTSDVIKHTLKVVENGETVKYKEEALGEIWAFEAGGLVYRVVDGGLFEAVYIGEKISVYEPAYNRMLYKKSDYVPGQGKLTRAKFAIDPNQSRLDDLYCDKKGIVSAYIQERYPQLKSAFECINGFADMYDKKFHATNVFKCFIEYDKAH